MKLGFLGDKCKVPYEVLNRAEEPSDIFNALAERLGSREAAVQRFIYALKRLGHRRNGYACVREYEETVGKDLPPKFEARNESESFGLCQCLVDICVKIKEGASRALIRYCGPSLLSTNPENISSLAYMFTTMCHKKLITSQDQKELAIALSIVNANECIECIRKYRLKYKLPEIVIEECQKQLAYTKAVTELQRDDPSSSSSTSPRSSRTNTIIDSTPSPPLFKKEDTHRSVTDYLTHQVDAGNSTSRYISHPPLHDRPHRATSEGTQISDEEATTSDEQQQRKHQQQGEKAHLLPENHDCASPQREQNFCIRHRKKIVTLVILIALMFLLGGIPMIIVGALSGSPHNKEVLTYDNTSAVITTFATYNTKEVTLQSDAEFDTETQYYQADSCSNLPSFTTHSTITGNMSLPPKLVGYFLEDSVLSYMVCSAAEVKVDAHHAIQFYILNNLRESSTKPSPFYENPTRHWTIKIGYDANVANQSEPGPGWICSKESELTFRVSKQSYYEVIVLPPSIPETVRVKYWYQSNITHKGIRLSSLTRICLDNSESGCTHHVKSHLFREEHCLISHIEDIYSRQAEDAYIRIQITFEVWNGLALFLTLGIVLVAMAFLSVCIVLYWQKHRRNNVRVNLQMSLPK